jgi:polar amino acid transport system substrate-binding protein
MRGEIPRILDEMQDGAKRIKRIVNDLKDFARRDDRADMIPLELNDVVSTALRLVEPTLRKATRRLVVDYAEDLPRFRGNAQRIEQVVVNLVINACQALPDPERGITVTTRQNRSTASLLLTVRDEGVGIDPENLSRLTDPFFTTKRDSGGTGLGLSVSTGIVKEHGGQLNFASTPGVGTTVTLALPAIG